MAGLRQCAGAAGSSGRSGLIFHSYSKGSEQTVLETEQGLWYSIVAAGADNIVAWERTVAGWVLVQIVLLVGVPGKSSSGAGEHHRRVQLGLYSSSFPDGVIGGLPPWLWRHPPF